MLGREHVVHVGEHMEIAPGINLVFTRSNLMGYFSAYPPHGDEAAHQGLPELSLSLSTEAGEVLVVGCSHSSVEAIVVEAREVLQRPIDLVVGGYHLIPDDASYIEGLAQRLDEEYGVARVAPAHCSGHAAFAILRQRFGDRYAFFGLGEQLALAP